MTRSQFLRFIFLPLASAVFIFAGASCSTTDYYFGSTPAVGGGYYVSQIRPAIHRAGWGLWKFGSSIPDRLPNPWARNDGSFWEGDDVPGSPKIRISLSEQMVYYYKGGKLVGMSPISSGREGYDTRPGHFHICEKDIDHKSTWYGQYVDEYGDVVQHEVDVRKDPRPPGAKFDGADMRYFMRIDGAVGMHEGYLPGYAASHGCIRLPGRMAEVFYHNTPLGTPVEIVR